MTEEIQEEFTPPRFDKIAVVAALLMLVAVQIVAAQRIGWVLEYPLDDVYIHLAMASEIARGGYGVNSGEFASAASSALYPVLLTPFPDSGLQRLLPLFWNVLGLGLCAWLWGRALIWAGYRGLAGWVLAIGVPVFTGSVSTSYVGMEHTLHAAASIAIVFGLARVLVEDRLNALLFVGILFSPLFRFEGLALCTLAIFVLAFRGRYFAAILGGVVAFVPIGLFVYYLLSLGLDPLPNSVQAKLVSNDDAGISFLNRTFGTLIVNLSKFGGIAILTLTAAVLLCANLVLTGANRGTVMFGGVASAAGAGALAYITYDFDTYGSLVMPMVMVLLVGLLLLTLQLFRSLKEEPENTGLIWFALALAGAGGGHVLLAQTGWMERYEHYVITSLALGLVILAGLAPKMGRIAVVLAVVAIGVTGARYVEKTATKYHWGSRAIHLQQYQMQRFAKEFLDRNVAVNDLGWVVWGNDNYVLDLYGLANHEARHLRIFEPTPGWGGRLVEQRGVLPHHVARLLAPRHQQRSANRRQPCRHGALWWQHFDGAPRSHSRRHNHPHAVGVVERQRHGAHWLGHAALLHSPRQWRACSVPWRSLLHWWRAARSN